MTDVKALIEGYFEKVVAYRRHLHRHPELSHHEEATARFIADTLRAIGLSPTEGVGGHGVVALIEGAGAGKCIALRADIDALPIHEETGLPFASQNPGVCHACGHDMHTAMLLGTAHVLYDLRSRFNGCVKLVFQPAEEDVVDCGALPMISDGVLEHPHVDAIIAQHVWPQYFVGTAAIRDGAMMAASDHFIITIKGKGCHGSAPEDGIDAIVVAAQVISALQTIVSRNVSPLDSAVVTVGTIAGGDRYNVVAGEVKMDGTCRNLNPSVRDKVIRWMERTIAGVTSAMGADYTFEYRSGYPSMVNDTGMFELVHDVMREVVGEQAAHIPKNSALGGEDFSYFCQKVPGAFFWLGVSDPEREFIPLHNGKFSPGEEAIPIGIEIAVRSVLRFLA